MTYLEFFNLFVIPIVFTKKKIFFNLECVLFIPILTEALKKKACIRFVSQP